MELKWAQKLVLEICMLMKIVITKELVYYVTKKALEIKFNQFAQIVEKVKVLMALLEVEDALSAEN